MSFDHVRRLHKQGYHAQAVEEIQSLRTPAGDARELVTLLADIYITQGYLNRAHSLLTVDGHVKGGDEHARSSLSMIRCFTGAIVSGKIWTSISEADRVYSDAAAFLKADPTAHYAVGSSSRSLFNLR